MTPTHDLARAMRRWHARLGVATALFFGVLVGTGIALNHTEALGLAQTRLSSPALARWFGLPEPVVLQVVELEAPLLVSRDAWFYRARRLPGGGGEIVGAVMTNAQLAIATADRLVLYTRDGERIETLAGAALPALPLAALGWRDDALVVGTSRGSFASADGLSWLTTGDASVHWSRAVPPNAAQTVLAAQLLVPELSLERIVLDIHAGRLFGRYGPWLVDTVAVVLLLLASSGVWIQWRGGRMKRRAAQRARKSHPSRQ